jgi:HAMP domain-containing protein
MAEQKRKLKNLMIMPRLQLKLFGYFAGLGLLFFVAILFYASQRLIEVQTLLNSGAEMDFGSQLQVNAMMNEVVQFTLVGFVVYIVVSSVLALFMSHRIAGPVVAITAFIEELKSGNYSYKRNLRPKDELKEVMKGLQELGPLIEQQRSKKE